VGGVIVGRAIALVAITLITLSCGSDPSPTLDDGYASQAASGEPTASALLGTWQRETRCEELVSALIDAGLEGWVLEFVAGDGFVPGVTSPDQIADPADPCDGAVPRVHSVFFDPHGVFVSLDWNGAPVDDGTYEVIDEGTFVVSKEFPDVTFHYTIEGDTIMFEPVIPECSPDCFEAAWSVSVAYPGEGWKLVSR
jgi:hypothetical protein